MNTNHHDDSRELDDADGRPRAVVYAERGQRGWQAAVETQVGTEPAHTDFYELAGLIAPTLSSLIDLANVLIGQVGSYHNGRPVYDDTRAVDPAARLAEAVGGLARMRAALADAYAQAQEFWGAISHIGVEHPGAGA